MSMGKFMVEYGCSHLGGRMYQENLSELLYSLFNTIPDPFMVIGEDGTYLEVFGGTERSLYDDGKPMQGKNIYEFMPKEFADFYMQQVHHTLEMNCLNSFDYQLETDKVILPEFNGPGGTQWFETRMFPLKTPYKGQRAVTAQIINITERRNLHKKLRELSYVDPLTGLYNRRYFLERVRIHLMEKGRAHIMLCDIDRFKGVNDQYGHLAGDAVLKEFANIAKQVLKHNHAIARLGGDEFVMALTDLTDEEAVAMGEQLRKQVEATPFHYQTQVLSIQISIGIAKLSYEDLEKSELIADADRALYQAKAGGKNRVCLFNDGRRGV